MFYQNSLGIALQDNQVVLVYLKNTLKGVQLVAHAAFPFNKDISDKEKGLLKQVDAAAGHVRTFVQDHGITGADVYLSIPGSLSLIRYIKLPIAVKENLANTLKYELVKYIPLPISKIYYDFQIVEEDKKLNQMTVLLTVVQKKHIAAIIRMGNKMQLGLSGIETGSSAIANYFTNYSRKDGPPETQLVLLQLTEHQLEGVYLKKNYLIQSRQIDISQGINQALVFVDQSLIEHTKEGQLKIFYGGTSTDETLKHELETRPGLTFQVLNQEQMAGLPSHAFIPAYGLALKGLKKVTMQLNLLPAGLRKQISKLGYYTALGLIGMALVLAVVWAAGNLLYFQRTRAAQNIEIQQLSKEVAYVQNLTAKTKRLELEMAFFQDLTQKRIVSLILKELTVLIPKSAWIKNMSFSDRGIRIEGEADSASNLIPLLEASPLFKEVSTLSITTKTRDGKDKFKIGLKLE